MDHSGKALFVEIGRVARAQGIKGEIRIDSWTDWPERFLAGGRIFFQNQEGEGTWHEVVRMRFQGRTVILKLEGIDDRGQAERLRGAVLKIRNSDRPPLEKGRYYIGDVVGLTVKTEGGRVIGKINEVLKMPAQDLYVVRGASREILIPAVRQMIKKIDVEAGIMVVDPVEGLVEDHED
ncbi:16S rRNA processing protein RimM [bacterium]|nr:16S rRNA processing protein RimM [bacterium]